MDFFEVAFEIARTGDRLMIQKSVAVRDVLQFPQRMAGNDDGALLLLHHLDKSALEHHAG